MGLSEREFLLTTPRYFYFAQKGWQAARVEQWRIDRACAYWAAAGNLKKGTKPEALFTLPGDRKELPTVTKEQSKRAAELLKVAKTVDWFNGGTMPKA